MRWFIPLGLAFFLGSSAAAGDLPREIKPVLVWRGIHSKQTAESFARCTCEKDWQTSWPKDRGGDRDEDNRTCPEVDFDSYMVVVLFHESAKIVLENAVEEKDCVRVRYTPLDQLVFVPGPKVAYEEGRTYALSEKIDSPRLTFVVLPRSDKALVVEENVRSLIDDPPVWMERARFPALATRRAP